MCAWSTEERRERREGGRQESGPVGGDKVLIVDNREGLVFCDLKMAWIPK